MGWATAWSFDRLRLWVERGATPEASRRRAIADVVTRAAVAFVWLYQGAVPKLLSHHRDELAMLRAGGLSSAAAWRACTAAGWAEVAVGLAALAGWQWPLWVMVLAMPVALAGVAATAPAYLSAAFNPVSLNVAVWALAVAALVGRRDVPSARRCSRRPGAAVDPGRPASHPI